MLPITKIPPLVAESAEHFKPVFSWHKKDAGSFCAESVLPLSCTKTDTSRGI